MSVQAKLLDSSNNSVKPDTAFLEAFADIVGSHWPSLATALSLKGEEIEAVKKREGERIPPASHALQVLMTWASKDTATYSELCRTLKTISLFQYVN